MCVSTNAAQAASGGSDGWVRLWDLNSGKEAGKLDVHSLLLPLLQAQTAQQLQHRVQRRRSWKELGAPAVPARLRSNSASVKGETAAPAPQPPANMLANAVTAIVLSADSTLLAIGCANGTLAVFTVTPSTPSTLATAAASATGFFLSFAWPGAHSAAISGLFFSTEEPLCLFASSRDGFFTVWPLHELQPCSPAVSTSPPKLGAGLSLPVCRQPDELQRLGFGCALLGLSVTVGDAFAVLVCADHTVRVVDLAQAIVCDSFVMDSVALACAVAPVPVAPAPPLRPSLSGLRSAALSAALTNLQTATAATVSAAAAVSAAATTTTTTTSVVGPVFVGPVPQYRVLVGTVAGELAQLELVGETFRRVAVKFGQIVSDFGSSVAVGDRVMVSALHKDAPSDPQGLRRDVLSSRAGSAIDVLQARTLQPTALAAASVATDTPPRRDSEQSSWNAAIVRFVGELSAEGGTWVGVQLLEAIGLVCACS